MDKYSKETIFHLPGLFRFAGGYMTFIQMINENPDILKDNVKIGSIFGSPQCIWNGGRLITSSIEKGQLESIRDFMNIHDIPVRFTFTNCLLEEKHTLDTTGNLLLEIFNTGKNEIICNTEVLENYIRNKYGDNYKYISSTTKRLIDQDSQLKEIEKNYYLIVLDYNHNKDLEFLPSLKHKEKCEILCNAVCKPNCPMRAKHYQAISKAQLENDSRHMFDCEDAIKWFWEVKKDNTSFISIEDINNIYLPMGFSNFKLEGRTAHPLDWIEIILYYLIKEEYKEEVRAKLQQAIW